MPAPTLTTQKFAAMLVGGMPERKALKESGLVTAINDLFKKNRPWVTSAATKGAIIRAPQSDSVLFFPAGTQPGRIIDSTLFARSSGAVYTMELEPRLGVFTLSKASPAGSDPVVTVTSQHLLSEKDDSLDGLKLLDRVLTGKVISATGDKPKTWPEIYPGYPSCLK
jgi:hypothetical protein